jgi:hypothetical protein
MAVALLARFVLAKPVFIHAAGSGIDVACGNAPRGHTSFIGYFFRTPFSRAPALTRERTRKVTS